MIDASVPVAVIYRGGYAAAALARTLGRLGVPMYLIAGRRASTPAWSSRYWAKRMRWDFSRPEEESLAFLLDVGATIRAKHGTQAILLTLADWVAIFIERNSQSLQEQFAFPQPVRPVLGSLLNKWEMHLLAEEHGIPTPATVRPASSDDANELLEATGFPIVMKAADRYLPHVPSNRIINSRRELVEEFDRETTYGPLNFVLQEYIPGDVDNVWMCNGYFSANPEHDVTFTGIKLRQVSATGVASLGMCVPNETVATQTRRFMKGVGYRGCVGIGYRFDRRDGLYKVLDVNARVSNIFRLFVGTNEMDVVRACYLDLTGQEAPATSLQPGRKWMLESDFISAMTDLRGGRLSIGEWIRSVRGVQEWHWLAVDDPVPAFVGLGNGLRRAGRSAIKRVAGTTG
jgi:D-aspartate ligase